MAQRLVPGGVVERPQHAGDVAQRRRNALRRASGTDGSPSKSSTTHRRGGTRGGRPRSWPAAPSVPAPAPGGSRRGSAARSPRCRARSRLVVAGADGFLVLAQVGHDAGRLVSSVSHAVGQVAQRRTRKARCCRTRPASSACSRAVVSPSSRAWPEKSGSGSCRLAVASDQPSVEFAKKTDRIARTDDSDRCLRVAGTVLPARWSPATGVLCPQPVSSIQPSGAATSFEPRSAQRSWHLQVGVASGERPSQQLEYGPVAEHHAGVARQRRQCASRRALVDDGAWLGAEPQRSWPAVRRRCRAAGPRSVRGRPRRRRRSCRRAARRYARPSGRAGSDVLIPTGTW